MSDTDTDAEATATAHERRNGALRVSSFGTREYRVLFDPEDADGWIQSDTSVELEEVR